MLPDDRKVLKAVHHQEPFVIHSPSCPASKAIDGIAMQILSGTIGLSTVPSQSFISKLKSYLIPKVY
ncbi:hypothetical protein HM131_11790 [Halobacillus mangrovi]|uniref:Uncharacterized protein n=1 Tax=Halobacillus mangrovi TaxID=402384 RepID=A0A1W5ZW09_9BACI|nr:hypothetical protein HM131_11790 [Halobacillus mangrovi]